MSFKVFSVEDGRVYDDTQWHVRAVCTRTPDRLTRCVLPFPVGKCKHPKHEVAETGILEYTRNSKQPFLNNARQQTNIPSHHWGVMCKGECVLYYRRLLHVMKTIFITILTRFYTTITIFIRKTTKSSKCILRQTCIDQMKQVTACWNIWAYT